MTVTIDSGSVIGGSAGGVGINVLGGASNSITNRGTIGAASGNALRAGSGSESLANYGTLTGDVDLGGGSNTINNYSGASFNSLASIVVGAGRSFINAGVLSPGGAQAAQSTLLTGNLQQQAGGAYHVDFSLAGGDSDHLSVSGSALLAGSIRVMPIDTGTVRIGNGQSTVLTAADGTTIDQLTLIAPASPLVSYRLVYPNSNEVAIASQTDFAPATLGNNAGRMGAYLNAIQKAGGSSALAPIIAALFKLPDTASLRVAYEKLGTGALGNQGSVAANASLGFNDALHSCRQRDGEYRFSREGECEWMRLGGSIRDQDRTDDNAGFRQDTLTLAGGLQHAIAADRYFGFGLAYQKSTLDSSYSDQDGERFEGGLILKRIDGPTRISGSLTASYGRYDSRRLVDIATPGLRAKGRQELWSVSLQGRISHDLAFGEREYLRPMLGLGVTYVARDSYHERGAGAANLYVASGDDTFVALQPAIEFGGERRIGDEGSLLRHFVRLGITHFLGSNERRLSARLEGAPAGVEPFTVITRSDRTYGDLALGIDLLRKDGTTARLEYNGQFSSNSNTHAIGLKLSMPF
ncbi:MAG: autotransporter domain-containing protein [Dechloromonas sp.]|nr:MAG: autotransporter domain-containing protein [Dechloromonas sp.]